MKRSHAQKTVHHVKIKSSEALKCCVSSEITCTRKERAETPQLLILVKAGAQGHSKEHGSHQHLYKSPPKP